MKINGQEININDLTDPIYMHHKIGNDIYLSKFQMTILDNYRIDYKSCRYIKELLFLIEEAINNEDDADDLEAVSKELSEFDYYHNTNK